MIALKEELLRWYRYATEVGAAYVTVRIEGGQAIPDFHLSEKTLPQFDQTTTRLYRAADLLDLALLG